MNKNSSCSANSLHLVLSIFLDWTVLVNVIPHCLLLQFQNPKWCWAAFHMLIHHLYISFCVVSVQKFCPFLSWVCFFQLLSFKNSLYTSDVIFSAMCFTNKYLVSFCGLSFLNVFDLLLDFQRPGVSLYLYTYCRWRLLLIGTECRDHGMVRDSQFFHINSVLVMAMLLNLSGYIFQHLCPSHICGLIVIVGGLE